MRIGQRSGRLSGRIPKTSRAVPVRLAERREDGDHHHYICE
jgi:hypothetical protein